MSVTTEIPIDAKEAGKMLNVNPRTVIRMAEQGKLPYFKVNETQWRFFRSDIQAYIDAQLRRPERQG